MSEFLGPAELQSHPSFLSRVGSSPVWSSYDGNLALHAFTAPLMMDANAHEHSAGNRNLGDTLSLQSFGDTNERETPIVTSKRKAHNRSAWVMVTTSEGTAADVVSQRNLRQRKMQHVQDLEEGINLLRDKQSLLHANNELLKLQLDTLKIENQVLHATIRPAPMCVDTPILVGPAQSCRSSISDRSATAPNEAFPTLVATSCCSSPDSEFTVSTQEARVPIPRRAHKKSKTGCRTCELPCGAANVHSLTVRQANSAR